MASDVARAVVDVLSERGPMTEDELGEVLRAAGVALADDPGPRLGGAIDDLELPLRDLADGRWVWLPALLADRVFTHRVRAEETEYDLLVVTPDLDPITALTEHEGYDRWASGARVRLVLPLFDAEDYAERGVPPDLVDEHGVLLLEPGTLTKLGVTDGDVVGIRLTPAGLELERVDPLDAVREVGKLLRTALAQVLDGDEPELLEVAVWTACTRHPELFAEPTPPLSETLPALRFAVNEGWLARAGFDFERWRADARRDGIAHRYGLDGEQASAVLVLVELHARLDALLGLAAEAIEAGELDGTAAGVLADAGLGEAVDESLAGAIPDVAGEASVALADSEVALAVVAETVNIDDDGAAALGLLSEAVEEFGPRDARPAARWLRSVAFERLGRTIEAEEALLAAEALDPAWPLPLLDLARFASDRGDAARGLSLLRRAGALPDHPLITLLERYQPEPRPEIGRNEPCWCGSGRKYKKCHLGREQAPLEERAGWLYQKAVGFALLGSWARDVMEARFVAAEAAGDPELADDPQIADIALDAVLVEDGAFDDFLATRGELLPDDERLLAAQWQLVERSVFEVTEVRRGSGVTVRDVRTGDVHEVRERSGSQQAMVGQLVCARVLPAADTMQFFGPVVALELFQRDPLITLLDSEPDAEDVVAFLGGLLAPPTLTNTEGEPLVFCTATLHVADPHTVAAALDDVYDRDDDGEVPQWVEHVTTHGMERIRATVGLETDRLYVEANSEARMDRVLDTLRQLVPGISVVEQSRRPSRTTAEAEAVGEHLRRTDQSALDPADPEIAAALDEFTQNYERRWLDEPIPALDDNTPRQAADDPTRREDLIKLLESFPTSTAPGMMDPDRIRAALDL